MKQGDIVRGAFFAAEGEVLFDNIDSIIVYFSIDFILHDDSLDAYSRLPRAFARRLIDFQLIQSIVYRRLGRVLRAMNRTSCQAEDPRLR